MNLFAYSLYDRKALAYHPPFFQAADGAAVRAISDLAQDMNTTVGRHPGDFVLYKIGTYDDSRGQLVPLVPLEHIIDVMALVPVQGGLPLEPPAISADRKNGTGKEAQ